MSSLPSVMPGKIILNSENPFMWLSEIKEGPRSIEASIWSITYSEEVAGHALFIKSELTDFQWKIYSENIVMARWLQVSVQGMLDPETADMRIPVIDGEFSRHGDVSDC